MINLEYNVKNSMKTWTRLSVFGLGLLLLSACATTEKVPINQATMNCAMLVDVCGKLTPRGENQADLRYINPAAQWTRYDKVMIAPVTFWGEDTTSVPASDEQTLVNYFTQQLNEALGKKFQIVDQPGPGVMKITVAMVDAEAATPVLRSISMIVPQAHMLANLKYLATGTFPFVGGAEAEIKVTDSVSGQMLGAAVDERIGGGSATTGLQWQWGDAEDAITKWCEMITNRLSSWTSGSATPS